MDEFRNAYFDVQTRGLDWWKPVWSEKEENREEWFVENSPGVRGCVALTPLQVMISFIFLLYFFVTLQETFQIIIIVKFFYVLWELSRLIRA